MGYLYLSISLLAGATKGFCGKKMGGYTTNTQSAIILNLIRMILCVFFGVLLIFFQGNISFLTLDLSVLLISALSGITTSIFVVSWLLSVRKSAYMMLDVFLMLGTIVPMLAGYVLLSETIRPCQWIGFAILVAAAIIMCAYNNSIKVKLTTSSFFLLILSGLANGLTDFSQKMFVKTLPDTPVSVFNLYTYLFAAITLAFFGIILCRKEKPHFNHETSNKKLVYIFVFVMSLSLILCSYFKTLAAADLDSAHLYPLNQGIALILSTLMASFFFKEKLTIKCIIGIVLSFIGLLVMNL